MTFYVSCDRLPGQDSFVQLEINSEDGDLHLFYALEPSAAEQLAKELVEEAAHARELERRRELRSSQ